MTDTCTRYLTKDELDSLVNVSEDVRNRIIIQLFFNSGCHVSEISKIQVEHIDFDRSLIHIQAENTRNNVARTICISESVASDIHTYLQDEHRNEGYLFRSRQSPSITARRIQQIIHCCAEKAGIQEAYATGKDGRNLYRVTPQTLRYSHIVHAILNDVPVEAVCRQAGSKHLASHEIVKKAAASMMDAEKLKQAYARSVFD